MKCRPPLTPSQTLITAVGVALYGQCWQAELARALGVDLRTVGHWAAGDFKPRPAMYAALLRLCEERAAGLREVAERLGEMAQAAFQPKRVAAKRNGAE